MTARPRVTASRGSMPNSDRTRRPDRISAVSLGVMGPPAGAMPRSRAPASATEATTPSGDATNRGPGGNEPRTSRLAYSAGTPRTNEGSTGTDPAGGGGTIGTRPAGSSPATSRRAYCAGTPRTNEGSLTIEGGASVPTGTTRPSGVTCQRAPAGNPGNSAAGDSRSAATVHRRPPPRVTCTPSSVTASTCTRPSSG